MDKIEFHYWHNSWLLLHCYSLKCTAGFPISVMEDLPFESLQQSPILPLEPMKRKRRQEEPIMLDDVAMIRCRGTESSLSGCEVDKVLAPVGFFAAIKCVG